MFYKYKKKSFCVGHVVQSPMRVSSVLSATKSNPQKIKTISNFLICNHPHFERSCQLHFLIDCSLFVICYLILVNANRPHQYSVDLNSLQQNFRSIQKRMHPDLFASKEPVFKLFSFLLTCFLNFYFFFYFLILQTLHS